MKWLGLFSADKYRWWRVVDETSDDWLIDKNNVVLVNKASWIDSYEVVEL